MFTKKRLQAQIFNFMKLKSDDRKFPKLHSALALSSLFSILKINFNVNGQRFTLRNEVYGTWLIHKLF